MEKCKLGHFLDSPGTLMKRFLSGASLPIRTLPVEAGARRSGGTALHAADACRYSRDRGAWDQDSRSLESLNFLSLPGGGRAYRRGECCRAVAARQSTAVPAVQRIFHELSLNRKYELTIIGGHEWGHKVSISSRRSTREGWQPRPRPGDASRGCSYSRGRRSTRPDLRECRQQRHGNHSCR